MPRRFVWRLHVVRFPIPPRPRPRLPKLALHVMCRVRWSCRRSCGPRATPWRRRRLPLTPCSAVSSIPRLRETERLLLLLLLLNTRRVSPPRRAWLCPLPLSTPRSRSKSPGRTRRRWGCRALRTWKHSHLPGSRSTRWTIRPPPLPPPRLCDSPCQCGSRRPRWSRRRVLPRPRWMPSCPRTSSTSATGNTAACWTGRFCRSSQSCGCMWRRSLEGWCINGR
mmetsp:Transcript_19208/g.47614  ORF Transcript_19208/g.47614 Transcript_19208/m.47614 type:complete len:223 (+) Transcript_19208:218-886(+)